MESNICYLDISTFIGTVAGAEHYWGDLYVPDVERVDLQHKLNILQARAMNKKLGYKQGDLGLYRAGEMVRSFWSESAVKSKAKKVWREHFPEARLLVCGMSAYIGPKEFLDSIPKSKKLAKLITTLHDRAEELEWKECGEMSSIYRQWEELLHANGITG